MPSDIDAGRRPRRDATANREALLAAAADALAEASDAPLERITSAAGLTRRAFYGHFANRDELVVAVIDVGAARLNAIAADTDDPHAPTAIALLGARLWGAVEHVRVLAGMAVREPYSAHAAEALAPVRDRLRALVERGIADGTVRPDIRPDVLARLVESAAIAVLLEAAVTGIDDAEGRRLVMLAVLGTAGLSWQDSAELIDTAPALAAPAVASGDPTA
ncbi:TetR/AcrR family transcriptional regulator [Agromyces mariniharenae]|uniref:TetR/AcrR family transcriptional regulator n=1 Tax=Agromyces mariniharenae TaxID=2604423 RepID=A0A5S4V7H3_9MICO|nr:TetR/AcrR family transcriptional regulator [Agromyces mariniharenae]TYL53813.1 TetR/AcrR family transcriptional regulator [Agromyces mariniharenae]